MSPLAHTARRGLVRGVVLGAALALVAVVGCRRPPAARPDAGADVVASSTTSSDPASGAFTLEQATEGLEGEGALVAHVETATGTIVIKLFAAEAPNTVANFVGLARGKRPFRDPKSGQWVRRPFYDGLGFHRLVPNFVIQGGDPLGDGTGGPGYTFADEPSPGLSHDRAGLVSMANAGPGEPSRPGTNGSQFFVTERPVPHLDGRHTIFGEVVEGLEVAKRIARMPADPTTGKAVALVPIVRVRITREPR
jgi:peptidyl-prolyl cis-trans isomerase A (cyclophilin A)